MAKPGKARKVEDYPLILTLNETADLLRVTRGNVPSFVQQGLPAQRVGHRWRFDRDAVLAWLRGGSQESPSGGEPPCGPGQPTSRMSPASPRPTRNERLQAAGQACQPRKGQARLPGT